MKRFYSIGIDLIGKLTLIWFVFCTIIYFYSGRFSTQIESISSNFGIWTIYTILQIPIAAIGIFVLIPLLLKGNIWGLILGIVHSGLGYIINPLWYIFPRDLQVSPNGGVTNVLIGINIFYSVFTLLVIVLFYFNRRTQYRSRSST